MLLYKLLKFMWVHMLTNSVSQPWACTLCRKCSSEGLLWSQWKWLLLFGGWLMGWEWVHCKTTVFLRLCQASQSTPLILISSTKSPEKEHISPKVLLREIYSPFFPHEAVRTWQLLFFSPRVWINFDCTFFLTTLETWEGAESQKRFD